MFAVSNHVIRIPPLRAGRRVSWTFEVSAADAADNGARANKTLKRRQRARLIMKKNTTSAPDATAAAAKVPKEPIAPLAIGAAGVAILLVAIFAYPRHSSAPGTDEGAAAATPVAVAASTVAPRANASSKKTPAPRPERNRIAESTKSVTPVAAAMPAANVSSTESAAPKLPGSDASVRSAAAAVPTGTGGTSPITITGCLEVSVDHDEFRLTDTDGVDAPKSRSWKSGFLKKRSAAVALVEPPTRLALDTHVGRRVTATGLLSGHDLKVSALRAIGPPCN
jgi:hypothetical protein